MTGRGRRAREARLPHSNASFGREVQRNVEAVPSVFRQKRNMPQRAVSKIERPQELRQAVHLIVMFAIRKGGNLALEDREPGGFLRQVAEGWLRRVC